MFYFVLQFFLCSTHECGCGQFVEQSGVLWKVVLDFFLFEMLVEIFRILVFERRGVFSRGSSDQVEGCADTHSEFSSVVRSLISLCFGETE